MKLPQLKLKPASDHQDERLARWLREWDISRQIDNGLSCAADIVCSDVINTSILYDGKDSDIACGQIRLFFPRMLMAGSRPLYFVVIQADDQDTCLIAPFGRFAEPCFPDEYLTGRGTPCLRVLCLWNRQELPAKLVENSWVADTLSFGEIQDMRSVIDHSDAAAALPSHLTSSLGPPCWHPADPRKEYMAKETAIMQKLKSLYFFVQYPDHKSAQQKAAEDRADWEDKSE